MKTLLALLLLFSTPSFGAYLSTSAPVTVSPTALTSTTGVLNWDMLSNSASGWYDTNNFYGSVAFDIYTTTTVTGGILTFEMTNDKTNDASGVVWNIQDATVLTQTNVTTLTLAASTVKHYVAPINSRYVRVRVSTAFAGTGVVGITAQFRNAPYVPLTQPVVQGTIGNLNATVNTSQYGGTTVVNGGVAGVPAVAGNIAAGTAPTANPLRISGLAFTAQPTARATGTLTDLAMTTIGAAVIKPYSVDSLDWQATSGLTPLATTTSTTVKAAGAAGIRNYVTGCQMVSDASSVTTLVSILDGATVIWASALWNQTTTLPLVPMNIVFPTPLRGTAATAMNIQLNTTGSSVFWNCQGYQAP